MRDSQKSPVTTGVAITAREMIGHGAAGFVRSRRCAAEALGPDNLTSKSRRQLCQKEPIAWPNGQERLQTPRKHTVGH
jgi:hypothetical protein